MFKLGKIKPVMKQHSTLGEKSNALNNQYSDFIIHGAKVQNMDSEGKIIVRSSPGKSFFPNIQSRKTGLMSA